MKNLLSRLPVGARLGLRDLTDNKAASVVLVVFLALVIGVALPLLLLNQQTEYTYRVSQYNPDHGIESFPPQADTRYESQAIVEGNDQYAEEILQASGLKTLKFRTDSLSFTEIPDPYWPTCETDLPALEHDDCLYSGTFTAANWSDPAYAAQVEVKTGRLPLDSNEVAIRVSEHNPAEIQALRIGDVVNLSQNGFPRELTVVGTLGEKSSIPNHALSVGSSLVKITAQTRYFGIGPDLSNEQIQALATALNDLGTLHPWNLSLGWYDWKLRAFEEDPNLLFAAARELPLTPADTLGSGYDSSSAGTWVFIAVLLLITLLSVPMFWQNHKQKTMQELQLKRSGASAFQLSLMRVTPAIVLGVSAAILGVLGSFVVLSLIGRSQFETSLWQLRLSVSVGFLVVVPLISGVAPALIASFLPDLTQRFSTYASIRFTAVRHRFDRPWSVVWPVFLLASAILVAILNALSANAKQDSQLYAIYAVCGVAVLISAYWLYSWAFTRIAYATNANGAGSMSDVEGSRNDHRVFATSRDASSPPLALRIAAKELQLSSGSAINTCIPITVLTAIAGFATVSGQQHDFTYLGQRTLPYPYLDNFLPFSVMIGILILLLAYLVAAQTSTEIQNHRLAMARHGMPQRHITALDGYRALIVTALGGISGYLLGTLLGAFAMIGWVNGYENATFNFRSLLPDANILVAVIAPIALSYLAGKLAGTRHLSRNEHLALRYSN